MKKRVIAAVLAGCLTVACVGCSALTGGKVRLGTAGTGGTYYAYGSAMGNLLEGKVGETTFEVKTTAGSAANLRLMTENYLQMAIAQSDTIHDAYTATGTFEGKTPLTGYGAVASLYTEPCQVVVRADSDIRTVTDLVGKKVSIGEEESGVMQNAEQILFSYGVSLNMIKPQYLSYTEAAAALADGKIDAFFCTAGVPTNAVANTARETGIRLLSLGADEIKRLMDTYPAYTACTIPAGTYEGQTEAVETLGVQAILLASNRLSAEQVHTITAALFEEADVLQHSTAANTPLALTSALDGVPVPFHAGAAKYYAENGITVESED